MDEAKNKFFRIGTLVTLYFGWVTFYQVFLISSKLGLMDNPSFIQAGIVGFLIVMILISLFTIGLFVPFFTELIKTIRGTFDKHPLLRLLTYIIPALLFFLLVILLIVRPFSGSFGAFRLFPLLIWSILFSLGVAFSFHGYMFMDRIIQFLGYKKVLWVLLVILFIAISTFFFLSPQNVFFQDFPQRLILFVILSLLGADCLSLVFTTKPWWSLWATALLIFSAVLIVSYEATLISPYPFTLGWSEGKWMLDGSLILAKKVYGFHAPIPFQEPTQAVLRAFPFLISNTPSLLIQRAWGFLLTVGIPLLTVIVLISKFKIRGFLYKLLVGLLVFCLLFLGPVKFYLLSIFLIFLFLYASKSNLRITLAVVVASLLIPPNRLNWYLAPGAFTLLFHILETPYNGNGFKYLWKPATLIFVNILVVGVNATLFTLFSGNPLTVFSVISSSPFLWYRLFFFPSSPLGVLVPAALISLPSIWFIAKWYRLNRLSFHWIRTTLTLSILLVFFLGGLLVSAKIGGGNNLHNLDIFFLLMAVVAVYAASQSIKGDRPLSPVNSRHTAYVSLANAILFSLWLLYSTPGAIKIPNQQQAMKAVQTLQSEIKQIQTTDPRPALFIYQTQLLTSGLIPGVKPVPNYDNVFLIEMAISNNQPVLREFYNQLEAHTWSVLVMPPLYAKIKDISTGFAEENNAWVEKIIFPMLCSYQSVTIDKDFDYELLVPRETNHQCP